MVTVETTGVGPMNENSYTQYAVKVIFPNGYTAWAIRLGKLYIHSGELTVAKRFQTVAAAEYFINMCLSAMPFAELSICKIVTTAENV